MVDMLVHMNILFDLRLLDVLFLYYYYSQALDKCKYYICVLFYIGLASLTSRAELARYLNEPKRVESSRAGSLSCLTWVIGCTAADS
jgi:hypothetical protein